MLKDYQGTISLKELSEMTAIKVEDVVSTLQHLNLIQYQKGQHVICAAPKLIERSVLHPQQRLTLLCAVHVWGGMYMCVRVCKNGHVCMHMQERSIAVCGTCQCIHA